MQYISTRGNAPKKSFSEIALEGLAPDGGLYVPEVYPQVSDEMLAYWRGLSYEEVAFEVMSLFATDIPRHDLWTLCRKTYTAETFCNARDSFESHSITPIQWVFDNLGLLELSNGPTLAFKDMAMQFVGNLFEYLLKKNGQTLNILGATSGDTGSAAEYAMRGREGIRVFMLSPEGRMSDFQRAQMYSLNEDNIVNLSVPGTFDDCQDIVKAIGQDAAFKAEYSIGTVNSINWARLCAQVVYYFYGYLQATTQNSEEIVFVVPTGNFGNVFAGWVAKQMGLPIHKLIVATNENDVLDEFFRTGTYRPRDAEHTYVTSSPSMDISKASNFERFVFDMVDRDPGKVKALWNTLSENRRFMVEPETFRRIKATCFMSGTSNHANRLETIEQMYLEHDIFVDPHTADGLFVGTYKHPVGVKTLCLETAQAAKFAETVEQATGVKPPVPAKLEGLMKLPQYVRHIDNDVESVKALIRETLGEAA